MNLFINNLFRDPQFFFTWLVFIVFSVCCHEFMHAYVALKQGDSTAADMGHLTLNPLKQMGLFSLIMLAVAGIAWGAVPVRPYLMRHRHSDALVAFAGPATNLGLFLVFGVLCFGAEKFTNNEFAIDMLWLGSLLNIVLFLLNLLPIPGLDGWTILRSFVPRIGDLSSEWMKGIFFILFFLVFFAFGILWKIGAVMTAYLMAGLSLVFG